MWISGSGAERRIGSRSGKLFQRQSLPTSRRRADQIEVIPRWDRAALFPSGDGLVGLPEVASHIRHRRPKGEYMLHALDYACRIACCQCPSHRSA